MRIETLQACFKPFIFKTKTVDKEIKPVDFEPSICLTINQEVKNV